MASSDSNQPRTFNPSTVPKPPPTYDQVAITPLLPTSKLVTLAGQVGIDIKTGKVPADFDQQVKLAHANVANALAAAGASPRDVIHVRHYLVLDTPDAELNKKTIFDRGAGKLWIEFMDREGGGHRPPDTLLGVAALAQPSIWYEVEVWAIIHT